MTAQPSIGPASGAGATSPALTDARVAAPPRLGTLPAIAVRDLSFTYPGADRPTLHGVSFEVSPGEFAMIIGTSGSGLSTLALCLTGIIPHLLDGEMSGTVQIAGVSTRTRSVAEIGLRAGLVFQDPDSQFCALYVEDELAFGLENQALPRAEIRSRVTEVLEFAGLTDLRGRPVSELSGGQKQRVAIASILVLRPDVVLLDVPTANLDPVSAAQVFELVKRIRADRDMTVIVIENDPDQAIELAERLIVLDEGRLLADGEPGDVLDRHGRELIAAGVALPSIAHAALIAREAGFPMSPLPITVERATEAFRDVASRLTEPAREPAATGAAIISMRDLSYEYPGGLVALRSVTLDIARGDIVGLLGPNGSGKTTLAKNLVGLLTPTSGDAVVCGKRLSSADLRSLAQSVGYVFQYPEHQFVSHTVFDEVAFGIRAHDRHITPDAVGERVAATIAAMGLSGLERRHPFSLSMGQKRRLSVATMLALDPEVLILDEPTTGQDRRNIDDMAGVMLELNERGITLLVITHDMAFVEDRVRTCVVLDQGAVAWQGPTRELFGRTSRRGALHPPPLHEVWRRLGVFERLEAAPITPAAFRLSLGARDA